MIQIYKNSVFLFFLFFGAFVWQNRSVEGQNIEIVNGDIADIKDFGYQIAVWYRWPGHLWYFLQSHYFACGGVIISENIRILYKSRIIIKQRRGRNI